MGFSNKKILITGSTRGIGRVTAKRLLEAGAKVAINGRKPAAVDETVAALGGVAAAGDLSSAAGCEAVVGQAVESLGGAGYPREQRRRLSHRAL